MLLLRSILKIIKEKSYQCRQTAKKEFDSNEKYFGMMVSPEECTGLKKIFCLVDSSCTDHI